VSSQPKSFRDVSCIKIARDGMVYVCDKSSNRIQVFDKSGKFIKEAFVAKETGGGVVAGSFGVINAAARCGTSRSLRISAGCLSPTA
jgi:hypothetical protein